MIQLSDLLPIILIIIFLSLSFLAQAPVTQIHTALQPPSRLKDYQNIRISVNQNYKFTMFLGGGYGTLSFILGATWDGRDEVGNVVSAGIYFLKLKGKAVGKVVKVR
ncbi:hypothetical protein KAX75_04310 [candidate division WOR-3 bacterium]|nr:hypothetical protein [candidate division WOR-3 bacterium]